jgi:hypothetical protein
MDTDFKWARDEYNKTQRSVDTWVFFAVFRTRLALLDQKWSYPGGFTGEGVRVLGGARFWVAVGSCGVGAAAACISAPLEPVKPTNQPHPTASNRRPPEEKKSARARGLARYLVQSILDLGPTFIKVRFLGASRRLRF